MTVKMKEVVCSYNAYDKNFVIIRDENGKFWGIDETIKNEARVNETRGNMRDKLTDTLRACCIQAQLARLARNVEHNGNTITNTVLQLTDGCIIRR